MSNLRVKAHEIIENISDKKVSEVLNFLEYVKIKEELDATNEIMNDKSLLAAIQRGRNQISTGELLSSEDVIENV